MSVLNWIDYTIVLVYLIGITALGSLFARKQKSANDFFLAGRSVRWAPMAISVIASDFSALTFLGAPGYVVAHDLVLDPLMSIVFIWVLPLTMFLFVRFFHRMRLITAYEYLERRFNVFVRSISSWLFICVRVCWMAAALYATGLAISQFVPVPFWLCVLIMGSFTALYSSLGGMKGVIWTDVSQFAIICLAIIAVLVRSVTAVPGGVSGLWTIAGHAGHTRLLNFDGSWAGVTTPAVLIGGTFLVLMSYGVDQIVIQRYMTAATIKEVRTAMVLQMWLSPVMTCALSFIGLAMFSYYTSYPERLAPGSMPDKWFPHFITHELPRGLSGLVIAGILAATMSSISSGMNSVTAATVIDFYRRLSPRGRRLRALDPEADLAPSTPQEMRKEVLISRLLTVIWGLVATGLGLVVGKIGLISLINKTLSGFFGGLLLGFFLLGILMPRANSPGALIGGVIGFTVACAVSLQTSLNFLWYAPVGCIATVAFGIMASHLWPSPPEDKVRGLTLMTERDAVPTQSA